MALFLLLVWGAVGGTFWAYTRWPMLQHLGDVGLIAALGINAGLAAALYNRLVARK